jgi:hypothetical protein
MLQGLLPSLVALLASTSLAQVPVAGTAPAGSPTNPAILNQQLPPFPWLPGTGPSPADALVPSRLDQPGFLPVESGANASHFWVQGEYMIGWIGGGPGSSAGAFSGGPGSSPLSGVRMTVGGPLGPSRSFGVEGSGMFLQQRSTSFEAPSNSSMIPAGRR